MAIKKYLVLLLLTPILLFGYSNNKSKIVSNMINKQEQITTLIENYILTGSKEVLDLTKVGNKYTVTRENLSKYFNINKNYFDNVSGESCISIGNICTNTNGLTFEMVENNNKYIGVRFYNADVFGANCPYCGSLAFQNLYKNIIIGDRIKFLEEKSVFYPLKRTVLDLFTKLEIYYTMYGNTLHIGSTPPQNVNQVWVDIRGSIAIERFWYSDVGKWLERIPDNKTTFVNSKADLLKLPTINGSKIKVLSDEGMTVLYSYNDVYKTSMGCTLASDPYCGWLKVITGMDDYDFIINGIQLADD